MMKYNCFTALVFLFLASLLAANTAIQPAPKSEKWLKRHETMVEQAQAGNIDILFLGDSITDYWPKRGADSWEREFGEYRTANFGISADRTQHLLWRLRNGIGEGFEPKVVVLLIGTNNTGLEKDGTPRNSTEEVIEGVKTVVKEVRTRFKSADLLLFGLMPRADKDHPQRAQVAEVNESIKKLHDGKHIFYIDLTDAYLDENGELPEALMPDKLHPNAAGYEIWADALRKPLKESLSRHGVR